RVYSEFDEIQQEPRPIGEYEGYVLVARAMPDTNLLSDDEQAIVRTVCRRFKETTSREISAISHDEPAWQKCHESHARIPFSGAFELKAV
ncbi:MAG: DUF4065 domain-containing protein, partial [Bacteroidales bacterium]|nr:DUF4065 domain-containing protein [Bacteroidales bacterium]